MPMSKCMMKACIQDLNPYLMCALCGGYFIDATTIMECLHSFCKSCIIRYLESSNYCPICDVQVHKTRPLLNIRADPILQGLVYKLVPGLFTRETCKRREFHANMGEIETEDHELKPDEPMCVKNPDPVSLPEEKMSISLEFYPYGASPGKAQLKRRRQDCTAELLQKRYLLCPAAFTINLVKKFIRMKLDLQPNYEIDVFHSGMSLNDNYTLMDIAYMYTYKRNGPFRLCYCVYERSSVVTKRPRLDPPQLPSPIPIQIKTEAEMEHQQSRPQGSRRKSTAKRKISEHNEVSIEKSTGECKEKAVKTVTSTNKRSKQSDIKGSSISLTTTSSPILKDTNMVNINDVCNAVGKSNVRPGSPIKSLRVSLPLPPEWIDKHQCNISPNDWTEKERSPPKTNNNNDAFCENLHSIDEKTDCMRKHSHSVEAKRSAEMSKMDDKISGDICGAVNKHSMVVACDTSKANNSDNTCHTFTPTKCKISDGRSMLDEPEICRTGGTNKYGEECSVAPSNSLQCKKVSCFEKPSEKQVTALLKSNKSKTKKLSRKQTAFVNDVENVVEAMVSAVVSVTDENESQPANVANSSVVTKCHSPESSQSQSANCQDNTLSVKGKSIGKLCTSVVTHSSQSTENTTQKKVYLKSVGSNSESTLDQDNVDNKLEYKRDPNKTKPIESTDILISSTIRGNPSSLKEELPVCSGSDIGKEVDLAIQ